MVFSLIVINNLAATDQALQAITAIHHKSEASISALQQPKTAIISPVHQYKNNMNTHFHRMGFSVEHPTVLSVRIRNLPLCVLVRVDQIRVLEDLGEEE